jgi:hypothetical protein
MFNIEKSNIKEKALPLLKVVLANEGKKPNFDDVQVLSDLYTEKYGKPADNFNDLFLFRESLVQKYADVYEAEQAYNNFVRQFDNILDTEVFFNKLGVGIAEHLVKAGMQALRYNINGLELQAQFRKHRNEFINFAPFSTTYNPSKVKPQVDTTKVNVDTNNTSHTRKGRAVTIEGIQYQSLTDYARSQISDLSSVTAYDKSLGRDRLHTPLIKKWLHDNKGIDL